MRTFVIALLSLLIVSCNQKDEAVLQGAIVTDLKGSVTIERDGSSYQLKNDMLYKKEGLLLSRDLIETGSDSYVDLVFEDRATIRIGENTKIVLEKASISSASGETSEIEWGLEKGSIISSVTRASEKEKYTITTPTSVASVRGTDFAVDSDPEQNSVAVADGAVEMESKESGEKQVIEAGNVGSVTSDGQLEVRNATKEIMENIRQTRKQMKGIKSESKEQMKVIIEGFKENRERMRENYSQKREEIRDAFDETKEANRQEMEQVREQSRDKGEDIREAGKNTRDAIKDMSGDGSKESGKNRMDEIRGKMPGLNK